MTTRLPQTRAALTTESLIWRIRMMTLTAVDTESLCDYGFLWLNHGDHNITRTNVA
jgi:hypothetical protein